MFKLSAFLYPRGPKSCIEAYGSVYESIKDMFEIIDRSVYKSIKDMFEIIDRSVYMSITDTFEIIDKSV